MTAPTGPRPTGASRFGRWWEDQKYAVAAVGAVVVGLAPALGWMLWIDSERYEECEAWIRQAAPTAVRRFQAGTEDRRGERCAVVMPDGSVRVKP